MQCQHVQTVGTSSTEAFQADRSYGAPRTTSQCLNTSTLTIGTGLTMTEVSEPLTGELSWGHMGALCMQMLHAILSAQVNHTTRLLTTVPAVVAWQLCIASTLTACLNFV